MGGLGNQLFQIFTCISYGLENNYNIIFPYNDILTTGTIRNTYWNSFLLQLKDFTVFNQTFNETNDSLYNFPKYNEKSFKYTTIPSKLPDKIMLYGYYQSYKYFDKYINLITDKINLNMMKDSISNDYKDLFQNTITISMHFRFGDYINIQNVHPLLTINYYYNALCNIIMSKKDIKINVLYFCQDNDYNNVMKIINKLIPKFTNINFVKVSDSLEDWEQMLLMSNCNHNIIANSTFSWWAAYLNTNDSKIICYPNIWFGPSINHDTSDLFPKSWQKIYW
jgi:hypothetical protein